MPCLEDLDISYPQNYFSFMRTWVPGNPDEVGVTDAGIEVLSCKLKGLRKINLCGNKFLTDNSLITLSRNCVYLKEIAVLNCSLVSSNGIQFLLRNSTNLTSLSVSGIDFGTLDDSSIRCARNVSKLEIFHSGVTDEHLQLLANADVPLRSFSLSYCTPSRFTFSGISSFLNKYRSLKSLCLGPIDFLTDEKMSDLSQYLSTLVTIALIGCNNLTESTFSSLANNSPLLEDISMRGANLDVAENLQIKSLNLENNPNLSDKCLAKVASVCPSLEVVLVSSCKHVTEKGISAVFKICSKIRKLWINGCGGIKKIVNGFELSELDFLDAAFRGICDDGLMVMGNRCHGLLDLNLHGCLKLTTLGLKELLTNYERLRYLNVTAGLNVNAETIGWKMFSRPSLRKIIVSKSCLPSESQWNLFLLQGCLICADVGP